MLGPNILGNVVNKDSPYQDLFDDVTVSGAFNITMGKVRYGNYNDSSVPTYTQALNFDAKKSSSLFGTSSTVQPASISALILIKT